MAQKVLNKKVIVYIHGMHGNAEEANNYKFLNDYDVIGLDYGDGYPWDVGQAVRKQFIEVIKPYDEVVVIANSIGCLYSYECLFDLPINHAFFISPVASMFEIMNNMMNAYGISEEMLKDKKHIKLENGTLLSYEYYKYFRHYKDNWKVPTDILYGSNDPMISLDSVINFVKNHPLSSLTIKEGAKHHFHTDEEIQYIKDWVDSKIR